MHVTELHLLLVVLHGVMAQVVGIYARVYRRRTEGSDGRSATILLSERANVVNGLVQLFCQQGD